MQSRDDNDRIDSINKHRKLIIGAVIVGGFVALGCFAAGRYKVALPTEYIVRTGLGIKSVAIDKHAFQLPFQTFTRLHMPPETYSIKVSAKSLELIPFSMPTVWTIGPKDTKEGLENYSKLLLDKDANHLIKTIDGIIQGEVRTSARKIPLNVLSENREIYRKEATEHIDSIFDPLGLKIYNSNIAELTDIDKEHPFFSDQEKRALAFVEQEARKNVSEAVKNGEIGEKLNKVEARKRVAELEKDATKIENDSSVQIAESKKIRAIAEAGYEREQNIAKAEAKALAEQRNLELQQKVEFARIQQETEKKRAAELSSASVQAEIEVKQAEGGATAAKVKAEGEATAAKTQAEGSAVAIESKAKGDSAAVEWNAKGQAAAMKAKAEADAYSAKVKADADAYSVKAKAAADAEAAKTIATGDAEAAKTKAAGEADAKKMLADADLVASLKKADGIRAIKLADAAGDKAKVDAVGGTDAFVKIRFVESGQIKDVADAGAKAVNGMNPKVNVWNTGPQANAASGIVSDLVNNIMPVMSAVKDITGFNFFGKPQSKPADNINSPTNESPKNSL